MNHPYSWIEDSLKTLLLGLIRIVETVVVAIADVDPGDAVAVVAGEQVSVAGPVSGSALIGRLVFAAFAVAVAVAVPRGRDAAVIRAAEGIWLQLDSVTCIYTARWSIINLMA